MTNIPNPEYVVVLTEDGEMEALDTLWEEKSVFKWPHEAILLLANEYKLRETQIFEGKCSKKKIWVSISKELNKHGYKVSYPQCQSKYAGLIRTYKSIKENIDRTGNMTVTWPYFNIVESIYGTEPHVVEQATLISSTGKRRKLESSSSSSSEEDVNETQTHVNESITKRQKRFEPTLILELKEERRQMEENIERRHRENMEIKQKLLATFENMCKLFSKQRQRMIEPRIEPTLPTEPTFTVALNKERMQVEENMERRHRENIKMKQMLLASFDDMCKLFSSKH